MRRLFFPAFLFCLCALLYAAPPQEKGWSDLPSEIKQKTLNNQGVEKDVRLVSRDVKAQYDAVADRKKYSKVYTLKKAEQLEAMPPYVSRVKIEVKDELLDSIARAKKDNPCLTQIKEVFFFLGQTPKQKAKQHCKSLMRFVKKLPNVIALHLESKTLQGIDFLKPLSNQLKVLWILNAPLRNVRSLENFVKLEMLKLQLVSVEDVSALGHLHNLRTLVITKKLRRSANGGFEAQSLDITPLKDIKNLNTLVLGCHVQEDGVELALAHVKKVVMLKADPLSDQLKKKWLDKITLVTSVPLQIPPGLPKGSFQLALW